MKNQALKFFCREGESMYDVIVIGAGPAGLTAALYAARAGKSVKVFEKENIGGQILYSPLVENYPGIPHMPGSLFSEQLSEQVRNLGVEIKMTEVAKIEQTSDGFVLHTPIGDEISKTVILATGVQHRKLGIYGEDNLVGAGVSYCAVCDGAFYTGEDVAVIGGGDTALQDAIFLASTSAHVTLIHRRDEFRAEASLVKKAMENPKIEIIKNYVADEFIVDNGFVQGLFIKDNATGLVQEINVKGIFVAIGQKPQNDAFANLGDLDESGYFDSSEDMLTKVPGVFVAGDARKKTVRQLTTAVGDGASAALAACKYIDAQ